MQRKKLLSLYGLKWNPFTPEVPDDGLFTTARIESFAMRIETMVHDGGFALITGEPGYGKSIALRIIEQRLCELPEVSIGVLARPQSGVADFYRELGDLFAVELRPHNRWAGFKTLRERWKAHAQASLLKPAILIDEAQVHAHGCPLGAQDPLEWQVRRRDLPYRRPRRRHTPCRSISPAGSLAHREPNSHAAHSRLRIA